jgi:transcriptional regulator with XRE-family HTH domain
LQPLDAERVKEWRHQRMLSQQEVANRAGTSLFTIQRIERGEGNVRPKTGRGVAAALGIPIEELLPKKAQAPSPQRTLFNGLEEERRSPLSPWAEYARRMAGRIRHHTDDPNSPAFRDAWAALFFVEEKNREAADLYFLLFEEEMSQDPYGDELFAHWLEPLSAFEGLAEALAKARERADRMGAGRTETDLDRLRRRADAAAKEREQQAAQISARLGSSSA